MEKMRRRSYLLLFVILMTLLMLPGCSGSSVRTNYAFIPAQNPQPGDYEALIQDMNSFGINTMNLIATSRSSDENLMISPASLSMALAMVSNGASGETRDQINALINTGRLLPQELSQKYNQIISGLYRRENPQIYIANSLWVDDGYTLKDDFVKLAKTYFDADTISLDLAESQAVKRINSWISDKTKGFIKDTLSNIDSNTATVLVNTLYFKGNWVDTFSKGKTQKEDFTLTNGEVIQVDMMNRTDDMAYYEAEDLSAVRLFYKGGASMLFIRPEGSIDELLDSFTADSFNEIIEGLTEYEVTLKLPKFGFKSKNTVSDSLKALGMTKAFTDDADFSALIDPSQTKLLISNVIHDTRIELDEEGTTAAAATVVEFTATAAMPPAPEEKKDFFLDKPFVFAIMDNDSGAVLFLGIVENPNAE